MNMNRKFTVYNFGCKVNQDEGGSLAALFVAQGWTPVQLFAEDAPDLIIVNTCTVTQMADKKARNLIRRCSREYPSAVLAVCGCYAQRAADEIEALNAVHIIAGVDDRAKLPQLVEEYLNPASDAASQSCDGKKTVVDVSDISQSQKFCTIAEHSIQQRARAYLKIVAGCDQFCHYCIIPHVRGPVRSMEPQQVLQQAAALIADGHQEIVLSGIHIGAYGSDMGQSDALPELIEQILGLSDSFRIRLGSIEPQQFSPRLMKLISEQPRLCRHLHIPLQSGCDKTLKAMGRRYDTAFYAQLLRDLRSCGGDIAFTSDVMVGFPDESTEDFEQSLEFCLSCGFADLHVFPYSRRPGTPAADFPHQVAQSVKVQRVSLLSEAAVQMKQSYMKRYVGKVLCMIAEEQVIKDGLSWWRGHSDNYLELLLPAEQAERGGYVQVHATKMADNILLVQRA